jgi:hypothetical protein
MKQILFALLMTVASHANAYFLASPAKSLDLNLPVHVLISGRGQDLGRQPQLAALGVAARIQDAHPTEQLVILSVFEDETNRASLQAKGLTILKVDESVPFNTSSLMPELLKFKKIASLQFFGHNSPSLGTQTDGPGQRFDFRERVVAQLAGHFTNDGFVFIHGCNAGWIIAPLLSRELNVPVAGAFTGTQFEKLNADGDFYVADAIHTPNLNWATSNSESYSSDRGCASGGCIRMRPANAPYNGHWGDLSNGGLGFYKFFCEKQTQSQCDRVMALSLINSLTTRNTDAKSTRAEFIEAAKDFVCPSSKDRVLSNECHQAMETALNGGSKVYSSFHSGSAIQCDFKTCAIHFACTTTGGAAGIGSCSVERTSKAPATTQTEEFLAYVRGFDAL